MPDTPQPPPAADEPADPGRQDGAERAATGGETDAEAAAPSPFEEVLRAEPRRRRRGMARKRGRVIGEGGQVQDPSWSETAQVRSESEEGYGGSEEPDGPAELLGANGEPITDPAGAGPAAAGGSLGADAASGGVGAGADELGADAGGGDRGGVGRGGGPADGGGSGRVSTPRVIEASAQAAAFLAMAVRSYLDGVDRYGADAELTVDRLERLRETLAVYDASQG